MSSGSFADFFVQIMNPICPLRYARITVSFMLAPACMAHHSQFASQRTIHTSPGVRGDGCVCILYAAAVEDSMAHAGQLSDDG